MFSLCNNVFSVACLQRINFSIFYKKEIIMVVEIKIRKIN